MGRYRFRFSDMMPNSWFYKLRDMGKTKTKPKPRKNHETPRAGMIKQQPKTYDPEAAKIPTRSRKSYYVPREFDSKQHSSSSELRTHVPDSPRKSAKQRMRRKWEKSPITESPENFVPKSCSSGSSKCRMKSKDNDIVLELGSTSGYGNRESRHLAPIITKSEKLKKAESGRLDRVRTTGAGSSSSGQRLSVSANSPGIKLRVNSPRISMGKHHVSGRRSVSTRRKSSEIYDSLAVMKSTVNPARDFKDSMLEMIVQNNITKTKDLEDLLFRYLSLNSEDYHEVIVKVFKRIWVELSALGIERN